MICFLQTQSFSFHKTFSNGQESGGLLVVYCDVFISCLDSQTAPIHYSGSISGAMLDFSKSIHIKKQTHLEGEYIFIFFNRNFWLSLKAY